MQNVGGGGRPDGVPGDAPTRNAEGMGDGARPAPPVGQENQEQAGQPVPGGDPAELGGSPDGRSEAAAPRGSNILAKRFLADEAFSELYAERLAELTDLLLSDGAADEVLTTWTTTLTDQATDLVLEETVRSEAASIAAYFD